MKQDYFHGEFHPAILYDKNGDGTVACRLCSHYCNISREKFGTCQLRYNFNGELYTLTWGKAEGTAIDPIEKKPLFHFKPGKSVLSFGSPGCNFKCDNCQNSYLSQSVRIFGKENLTKKILSPEDILNIALKYKPEGIAYTYSEPTIFFEYARDTILACKENKQTKGMFHIFVTNGFFSSELTDMIITEKLLDAVNIDLKFANDEKYKKITGGKLQPVIENIQNIFQSRIHLEITNLVIPGENDTEKDFYEISEIIASVSCEIPLHFSRFFPHYKMGNKPPTDINKLILAKEIAKNSGIRYVYLGNVSIPGAEDTLCPNCKHPLIIRNRYQIMSMNVIKSINNKPSCPKCATEINLVL